MTRNDLDRIDIVTAARIARERGAEAHARLYRGLIDAAVRSVRDLFSTPGAVHRPHA